jgi:hypothetical protein
MNAHSYTNRISPIAPFLKYLPLKPDPCTASQDTAKPIHPHEEQHPQHGSGHTGLEPTH